MYLQMISKPFLNKSFYKGKEEIKEQYWNGKELFIITKLEGKWILYNHTQNKKLGTSKDWMVLNEKYSKVRK